MAGAKAGELYWEMTADVTRLKSGASQGEGIINALGVKFGIVSGIAQALTTEIIHLAESLAGELVGAVEECIAGAAEAESNFVRLEAILKATDHAAGFTGSQLNQLAQQLQNVSTYEDDTIVGALGILASFRNIRGDVFEKTAQAALDLSAATGQDLTSSMHELGRALNDPLMGMMLLHRAGINFTQYQKDQIKYLIEAGDVMGAQRIILDEFAKRYGGTAAAAVTTFSGKLQILKNDVNNTGEIIGGYLLPPLKEIMDWLHAEVPVIQGWATAFMDSAGAIWHALEPIVDSLLAEWKPLWEELKSDAAAGWQWIKTEFKAAVAFILPLAIQIYDTVVDTTTTAYDVLKEVWGLISDTIGDAYAGWVDMTGESFTQMRDDIIDALIATEYMIKNWKSTLLIAFGEAMLWILKMSDEWDYLFDEVIPGLLSWFEDNFSRIIDNSLDAAQQMFMNFTDNVKSIFSALWAYISGSTSEIKFDLKPLVGQMKNQLDELPQFKGPQASEATQGLDKVLTNLENQYEQGFGDFYKQQKDKLNNQSSSIYDALFNTKTPDKATPTPDMTPNYKAPNENDVTHPNKGASFVGLKEAFDNIQKAAFGTRDKDPQSQTANNTKSAAEEAKKTAKNTEIAKDSLKLIAEGVVRIASGGIIGVLG